MREPCGRLQFIIPGRSRRIQEGGCERPGKTGRMIRNDFLVLFFGGLAAVINTMAVDLSYIKNSKTASGIWRSCSERLESVGRASGGERRVESVRCKSFSW